MYRSVRIVRIVVSLIAMAVPTWALLAGYKSVFVRMQIMTSLLAGVALCLLFWAAVTLIYGRIYCSTVCPLGTLMDCVSATGRLLTRRRKDYRWAEPSTRTRFIFLIVAILTMLTGLPALVSLFDPYSAFARIVTQLVARPLGLPLPAVALTVSSLTTAAVTALVVVAIALRRGRFICNTACPVGTILGIGSRRAYFHIEIDPDRCIGCGECVRVCKAQCIRLPQKTVDGSRCVVCFDCTAVCPNEAISYKSGRYKLDMPMMQSLKHSTSANSQIDSP